MNTSTRRSVPFPALLVGALLALTWLLGWGVPVQAQEETPPPVRAGAVSASVTLTPSADTYISSLSTDTNYGSSDSLSVSILRTVAAIDTRTLLRFDLAAIPSNAIIDKAELRLYQTSWTGDPWNVAIHRILGPWSESSVTWGTQPSSATWTTVAAPSGDGILVTWDVTGLVEDWVYRSFAYPNYGLMLLPNGGVSNNRVFDSKEKAGGTAPVLYVEYTLPPSQITIPRDEVSVNLDGVCDTSGEYAGAVSYQFASVDGLATFYVKHDGDNLYLCIQDVTSSNSLRRFRVYLDTDNGKEKYAEGDDFALEVAFDTNNGPLFRSYVGTGSSDPTQVYSRTTLPGWSAWAVTDFSGNQENAEYKISLADFTQHCGAPFGLAVFRHDIHQTGDSHGWPNDVTWDNPLGWVTATLDDPRCIRVCSETADPCTGAATATLYRYSPDSGAWSGFSIGSDGYVLNHTAINLGDTLWARQTISETSDFTLYGTSGQPIELTPAVFQNGTLTMTVGSQDPLMLRNLDISAQWNLEGDAAYKDRLKEDLVQASNFLYDFTDGQMALGRVTVFQDSENWETADVRLYASNNLRPWADAGGVVTEVTPDPQFAAQGLSFYPGHVYMGATWNRFHLPGNPSIPGVDTSQDWSLAFAHELGHYLLFLFDTYLDVVKDPVTGEKDLVESTSCVGSAMGWVYEPSNQEFIFDSSAWTSNCGETLANYLAPRTEWETIALWYPWVQPPTSVDPGPSAVPMSLTNVVIQPPPPTSKTPLLDQTFTLSYQGGESSSEEARAFLLRNDRVMDQGKPPAGTNQITLVGAQADDRFCVFDINDHAEGTATPRQQFGCEILAPGDNVLALEKDTSWTPVILASPVTSTTLHISVTLPVDVPSLKARLYPESETGLPPIDLTGSGGVYSGTVSLSGPVPAAYVQLWVDETATETDPRREVMVDYGIGGSSQHGPASRLDGAPVVSSDGKAKFVAGDDRALAEGEFIAWQSMAGTPNLPSGFRILGQSYNLMAVPTSLAAPGVVSLRYDPDTLAGMGASAGQLQASASVPPVVGFWDGSGWQPLTTQVSSTPDGEMQAVASSQGVGIYGLLVPELDERIYLPMIQR